MNTDELILQILDSSRCLSKKQMLDYRAGKLFPEELRAVELHLAECELCNHALDGFDLVKNAEDLLENLKEPTLPILKKSIPNSAVNKTREKPAEPIFNPERLKPVKNNSKSNANSLSGGIGIAMLLLIGFSLIWYFELKEPKLENHSEKMVVKPNGRDIEYESENKELIPSTPTLKQDTESTHTLIAKAAVSKTDSQQHIAFANSTGTSEAADVPIKKEIPSEREFPEDKKANLKNDTPDETPVIKKEITESPSDIKEKEKEKKAEVEKKTVVVKIEEKKTDKEKSEPNQNKFSDYETGVSLFKKQQYASALLYLNAVEDNKSNPNYWDAVYYSALCNINLNNKGKAKKQLKQIIKAGAPQKSAAEKQLEDL